ncbi:MAG: T9SS type A sorting domain-containing protein [Bacteroidetes bacterium]|nr:T9SS type A sorting domain-containing protein [Fibrella sp.]
MKQLYFACLLAIVGLLLFPPVSAQKSPRPLTNYERFAIRQRALPGRETICPASTINSYTRTGVRDSRSARTSATVSSTFIVDYTGFSTEAQAAFQYAVDIWSTVIVSPVPIRIKADWVMLNPNALGGARPATTRIGSDGRQWVFAQYPVALAEKIARRPLNAPTEPDIIAQFNRNTNWYFGTDGNPPTGQYDLVTVVLHEIGHGLGFVDAINSADNNSIAGYDFPAPYDHFVENNAGNRLVDAQQFANNSTALLRQLTGGQLYFNGPIVQQRNGQRARLYAPTTYAAGSTLSHLNETTYPPGDINSLMTFAIGPAEAIHTPGPLVMNMFTDMEWKTTSVLHTAIVDQEEVRDLAFQAQVISDTTLIPGSVRFFYHTGPVSGTVAPTFTEGPLTRTGTDQYAFTLPAARAQGDVQYYFQAQDASGRTFTNPGKNLAGVPLFYQVVLGPDNVAPTITHSPKANLLLTTQADSIQIVAGVTDDRSFGIDTAYVEYLINGVAQPNLPLRDNIFDDVDSLFSNSIRFATPLRSGDRVQYRIVARDNSNRKNQTVSPATGYYELTFVAPQTAVRMQYSNTFANAATAAADFAGTNFSIAQPTGFTDGAIHSEHPYRNGADENFQSNYTYTLLAPIQIKANPDSATMRFDEIVLVEPGEDGSTFGGVNFFDYVVVEGSKDNGRNWLPFLNGYNSTDQPDWLTTFNSRFAGNIPDRNSVAVGTPALYKRREISLQGSGAFQPNDQVLIRFRLFADQLVYGWGWAIDNLQIQIPPPPPVLATAEPVNPAGTLSVYPNPVVNGLVRIDAQLTTAVTEAGVSVQNAAGQTLRQQTISVSGTTIKTQFDVGQLPSGLYFLKLQAGDAVLTKKVLVTK